jgi:hypothetical protein
VSRLARSVAARDEPLHNLEATATLEVPPVAEPAGPLPAKIAVVVKRTGGMASGVTVPVTVGGGSATAAVDYNAPASPVLVFAAGQASAQLTIDVLPDGLIEGEETIPLSIGTPTGGAVVGTLSASGGQDRRPPARSAVRGVDVHRGGDARGHERRDHRRPQRARDHSRQRGRDRRGGIGHERDGLHVHLAAHAQLRARRHHEDVHLPIHYTSDYEGTEFVTFALGAPSGATIGPRGAANVVITDHQPVVQFAAPTYSVSEPTGSTPTKVALTVKRVGNLSAASDVDYFTTDGSATAAADYSPVASGTLHFAPGQAVKSFTIDVLPDFDDETNEDFTVTLVNPQQASLGAPAVALVTIADNDAGGTIEFTSSVFTATENSAFALLSVKRTGGLAGNVTVLIQATNGTADASDYPPYTRTVTLGPNQTGTSFFINLLRDSTPEAPETINLTLANRTGGAVLGTTSTAVLWVID